MSQIDFETPRVFVPLLERSRYKAAWGGRSSGKSWFYADGVIERCIMNPGFRVIGLREIQRALKESVKLLIEDRIRHYKLGSEFRLLSDRIITPGNGLILFQGLQDHTSESIKSLEGFDLALVEEAQTITTRSLEMLRPTIRKEGSELWFAWNPRHSSDPVDQLFRGPNGPPPDSIVVKALWRDNPFLTEEAKLEREHDYKARPDRYAHIWEGEYEPQAVGALFNRIVIHRNRRAEAPQLERILVAVDPPIASPTMDKHAEVAEAGIVVGGIGTDGRGYLIADYSMQGTPQQWGERVIAAYDMHEADAIVAEVNQGGEMVKHVLHSIRPGVRVIPVHATRGKHVRAEPVASLYELDRISHVGSYPEIEGQLCLFTASGYQGDKSPDRADAAIWLFTALFNKLIRSRKPKATPLPSQANNKYSIHRRLR